MVALPHPSSTSSSSAPEGGLRARALLLGLLAGTALYLFLFAFVLDRPLTVGEIGAYMDYKVAYLATIKDRNKILVFAGSNGRYSHRCETIEATTGIACANLSSAAGYDLAWQMSKYWPYLHRGDVLYMPLEYWPLLPPGATIGSEAPFVVRHDHAALARYTARQLPFALFYFDVRTFFSSIGEMLLNRAGVQRRTSVRTMTRQGDESGVSASKAAAYRDYVNSLPPPRPLAAAYEDAASIAALDAVIGMARTKGVVVVGGLPTLFSDAALGEDLLRRVRALYVTRGACFITLPNLSRYPRSLFFDTAYHLQEAGQIAHSRALSGLLAQISRSGACPAGT